MEFACGLLFVDYSRYKRRCLDVQRDCDHHEDKQVLMEVDHENQKWADPVSDVEIKHYGLHAAIKQGDRKLLEEYLYSGANANMIDCSGVTPLILASVTSQPEIVQLLLEAGAVTDFCSNDFGTALHAACFSGYLPIVDTLLHGGANGDIAGPANQSCLFLASLRGHLKVVKLLVNRRVNLNSQDKLGLTALHAAIIEDNVETALYLIQNGASVNRPDSKGNLPIHYAVKQKQTSLIRALVKAGCSVECTNTSFETPLLLAVRTGHLPTLSLLVQLGSPTSRSVLFSDGENIVNTQGITGLRLTGCRVNASKPDGNCPLHLLVSKYDTNYPTSFKKVLEILLIAGCDINTQAFNTLETPLYRAISFSKAAVAEVLLAYGANPNISSPFDITALHLAFLKQLPQTATMMLHSGINWNRERWLSQIPYMQNDEDSQKIIMQMSIWKKRSISLVNSCRMSFRTFHGKNLFQELKSRTDIPLSLKNFLLFSDISNSLPLMENAISKGGNLEDAVIKGGNLGDYVDFQGQLGADSGNRSRLSMNQQTLFGADTPDSLMITSRKNNSPDIDYE